MRAISSYFSLAIDPKYVLNKVESKIRCPVSSDNLDSVLIAACFAPFNAKCFLLDFSNVAVEVFFFDLFNVYKIIA